MSSEAPKLSDLFTYVGNILQSLVPLIGFLAFIMILVSGFSILTAGSNAENLEKGKKTLTYAVIGLILAIISWLSLKLIAYLTGANILEFQPRF